MENSTTNQEKCYRPGWDEYFLKAAMLTAERSTCLRHHMGAVAVRYKRVLATGYNGAPKNTPHCSDLGCLRNEMKISSGTRHEICRAVHAEQNVIIQASLHGTGLRGSTIYCTHTPCILCAKMLVNAEIKRFVTCADYADNSFIGLFQKAGIIFDKVSKPHNQISELDIVKRFNQI